VDVSKIIDDLYEGTLDPLAWDRAILGVADAVRASGAMLFAFNPSNLAILRDENHRVDPQTVRDYARHWTYEDDRLRFFLNVPAGQPVTEVSLAIPDLKRSAIYNEFLLPVDLPHFLPIWLHKSQEKAVALSLLGSSARGAFETQDLETVRRMLPHLARAFEIRDRLEAAEVRAANFANLLDTTTFGVIVLNAQMKILETNAVAPAILLEDSVLHRGKDGVLITGSPGGDRLSKWRLPTSVAKGSADGLMHIQRREKLPLSVLVLPVPALRTAWMSGAPAWVLLLFDPERRLAVNQPLIMCDLGLSEREAQVASLLAAGLQIDEIAKRLHVTVHTVRSQLKTAFQKTGCHTQAQLVKRVLLGPGLAASCLRART
jgi:DNA-binding CsgD family transcriptional regulator/PAS domain-containing protein